jgi:hypothetical protein
MAPCLGKLFDGIMPTIANFFFFCTVLSHFCISLDKAAQYQSGGVWGLSGKGFVIGEVE